MSDIQEKVTAIIVDKLGVDAGEVNTEASFTNDLGADSLDTVELIMEFEKEFNIAIPDDQAEKISTVGQAVDYILFGVRLEECFRECRLGREIQRAATRTAPSPRGLSGPIGSQSRERLPILLNYLRDQSNLVCMQTCKTSAGDMLPSGRSR